MCVCLVRYIAMLLLLTLLVCWYVMKYNEFTFGGKVNFNILPKMAKLDPEICTVEQ